VSVSTDGGTVTGAVAKEEEEEGHDQAQRRDGSAQEVGGDESKGEAAAAEAEVVDAPPSPADLSTDLHGPHVKALAAAKLLGLNVTLHAGEDTDADNVRAAVFDFGAARIGHGYRLVSDPELLRSAVALGVHFECCPTSSLETGGWEGGASPFVDWSSHPLLTLMAAGASVSINSDDPSVFATSLTEELELTAAAAAPDSVPPPSPPFKGFLSAGSVGLSSDQMTLSPSSSSSSSSSSFSSTSSPPLSPASPLSSRVRQTPSDAAAAAASYSSGMGLTVGDLARATLDAADAAFVSPAARNALRVDLLARMASIGVSPDPRPKP